MCTRDMSDAVSHRNDCQAESDCYSEKTNMSEECCAATSENLNECAEQLGEKLVTRFHDTYFLKFK